jgi:hypothetical protein
MIRSLSQCRRRTPQTIHNVVLCHNVRQIFGPVKYFVVSRYVACNVAVNDYRFNVYAYVEENAGKTMLEKIFSSNRYNL